MDLFSTMTNKQMIGTIHQTRRGGTENLSRPHSLEILVNRMIRRGK